MAKKGSTQGMNPVSNRKARGRTNITGANPFNPSNPKVPEVVRAEVNRAVTAGGGSNHRGDRRDTSPTYTNNQKHASRGSNPRVDVKTRKR